MRAGERWYERRFSILELLAIIGIVALVAMMLFPALLSVQARSKQLGCLHNLSEQGLAVAMYAEDNNQMIPRYNSHSPGVAAEHPWQSSVAFQGSVQPTAARYNMAGAYPDYLTDPGMLYCPGQERTDLQMSTYRPWPTLSFSRAPNGVILTAYSYNPHVELIKDEYIPRFTKLQSFPQERALCLDLLYDEATMAHAYWPGWNLLFADGHTAFKRDNMVLNSLRAGASCKDDWDLFAQHLERVEMAH